MTNSAALKVSSTLAINTKINELLAARQPVYHLGFGESRFPVHPKILAALLEHASERSYLPVAGLPALREAIAGHARRCFGLEVEAGQIIVGSGSKSLLFAAIQALPGDMLLPSPSWVSYDKQAYLTGKAVHWIPTSAADQFCLTATDFQAGIAAARAAGQRPGILVLNSPNNPTGVMYPPELLARLAEVAKAENVVIISDEIYALTAYGQTPHRSMARYYPDGTVVTSGLSKHLSLGGWRLGYAIVPPNEFGQHLHQQMAAIASNIWTTAAAPVQHAAVVAYGDLPDIEAYVQTCATIHGLVTGYLYEVLTALGVPCPQPSGGFYLYPSFAPWRAALAGRHSVHTSDDLAHFLLDEEHIATLPGTDFGANPNELTLRLATSYLYALDDADGETLLATYRQGLPRDQFLQAACPKVIEVGERFRSFITSL
ncbi:MAG: aminotransferase class I/II-fold pyridoxal phosphate-dependent enzyme [Anaerolineae bacterium]|nr:aminotransferase class I/II-fold pyridoxal phosphate-dependent enzyme [Anaerolineae bacterium]